MKDDIVEGYNWTRSPFREDPITHRKVCKNCWNQFHGEWHDNGKRRWFEQGCKVADCACACFDDAKAMIAERAKKSSNTRARKALAQSELESPTNPLRALNPKFEVKGA